MGRDGLVKMILVVLVGVVVMMTEFLVHADGTPCIQPRGECRLKTQRAEDGLVTRNVSCYCKHGGEVSHYLNSLSQLHCMNTEGEHVNVSILHIVGCNVTSKEPVQTLLSTFLETSDKLEVYVERSGWLSMGSPSRSSSAHFPSIITVRFFDSNISGMPEGVVGGPGVMNATFLVQGCEVGVLETRAFSSYSPGAQVTVSLTDTKILTVQQGAFDLPPEALVEIRRGEVLKFDRHSFSGGAQLTLDGVRVVNLLESAINIYGLKKLSVTNCTMAAVYHHALNSRAPTYVRNITLGDTVLEGSEAIFSENKFMSGNGQAFAQLCNVANVTWHSNIILMTDYMPLTLQAPECTTQRDWLRVFSRNSISCERCTDFADTNAQTCALFTTSYCVSCETPLDNCSKPVLPYIISKCKASHPDITKAVSDTCDATLRSRTPKALLAREADGSAAASLTPAALGVTLLVSMLLLVKV